MYNGGKIIIGLIIFLIAMTSPIWYNATFGDTSGMPDIEIITKDIPGKDKCVLPREEMRSSHMDILDDWRDIVIRDGKRVHTTPDGRKFNRSLSYVRPEPEANDSSVADTSLTKTHKKPEITRNSCMDCHSNKDKFCDRCHNYTSVDPYCWECHIIPEVK
ncbi:MAG: hypothetical protein P9X24_07150 [Candidatus Hatepunaea meridiana]|nr:hypothetical protein [Candidatus Hatepunaea meridiana]